MWAEELNLTHETVVFTLMEEKVCQLGEKFGFAMDILLEVPREYEWIIDGTVMRVTNHEKSLNVELKISMLQAMVDLPQWYWLCPT